MVITISDEAGHAAVRLSRPRKGRRGVHGTPPSTTIARWKKQVSEGGLSALGELPRSGGTDVWI